MRRLAAIALAAVPAIFAQARGPAGGSGPAPRPSAPMARRGVAAPPARGFAPGARPYGFAGGYPVYVLGYDPDPFYYSGDYAPATDAPPPEYYTPDPNVAPAVPDVIVNPDYKPDTTRSTLHVYTYTPGDQNPPAPPQVYFLIAMKDHTIYAAIAYWLDKGTLNYVDRQGAQHQVALDQVDRDFSAQLNRERHVDFGLPPRPGQN